MRNRNFSPSDGAHQLVTRQEHSRSLEDTEKYQAIEQLKSVGLLMPFPSFQDTPHGTEVYHGRVREAGEKGEWQVDQRFDNSGNNTGNRNVNKVPSLAVGSLDVAKQFADARSRGKGRLTKREAHEIISSNPDAVILDSQFRFDKLSPEDRARTHDSLRQLVSQAKTLLSFEEREVFEKTRPVDFNVAGHRFVTDSDVRKIADQFRVPVKGVEKVAGALNAKQMIESNPIEVANLFLGGRKQTQEASLNLDYVASWMRSANIVGVKSLVYSVTLDETIRPIYLFDLQHVNTRTAVAERRGRIFQKYQGIINKVGGLLPVGEEQPGPCLSLLANQLHAKPEQLVEGASQVANFRQNYEADAGNWERFSLGEHTETVLRIFDENYADNLPVEMLPIMRLILLTHDLGKPQAVADGKKQEQLSYNLKEAVHFCVEAGANKQLCLLVHAVIGAEPSTFAFFKERVKGDYQSTNYRQVEQAFLGYCADRLKWISGGVKPTDNETKGFANMCLLLQACDSAAYTDMAVTRSGKGSGYFNYPSFNPSFKPSAGLTHEVADPWGFQLT